MNRLFYGDNLDVLRERIPDESVDLVYLDPPFNSNRNYNVLFKQTAGSEAPAQIQALEDTLMYPLTRLQSMICEGGMLSIIAEQ